MQGDAVVCDVRESPLMSNLSRVAVSRIANTNDELRHRRDDTERHAQRKDAVA